MSKTISSLYGPLPHPPKETWDSWTGHTSSHSPKTRAWTPNTPSSSSATSYTNENPGSPASLGSPAFPPVLPCWKDLDVNDLPSFIRDNDWNALPYDLRPKPREMGNDTQLTWLDQDGTANYDPKAKHDPWLKPPGESFLRRKRPPPERAFNYAEYRAKRPKTASWQQGRLLGKRKVVTFSFVAGKAFATLRAYGSSLDNWPTGRFLMPNGEPDWEAWWNSHEPVHADEYLHWDSYDLRERAAYSAPDVGSNDDDGFKLEDVTLGHPAARGCKACFQLGHPCPLLQEGSRYPCSLCVEDDMECELVTEPLVKARCNCCTKRKIVCSFVEDGRKRGPCVTCDFTDQKCVAGPKGGRTRTGPCLDAPIPTENAGRLGRASLTCTQCREAGQSCSLKGKREKPPCNRCLESDVSCTLEARGNRKHHRHATSRKKTDPMNLTRIPLIRPTKPKLGPTKSSIKTIVTRLANPIHFNYEPTPTDTIPCHWCDDLVYGLLGLGEVRIEVIDYHDNEGLIEITGGHTAAGHSPSKMCDMCTLDRIMMAACRVHELEPIEGMDPEIFDFTIVTEYMMPAMAATAPFQWCSICPAPAFFRCGKKMDVGGLQAEDDAIMKGQGCGLVLCEMCAVSLVGEHDGNLEGLIDAMRIQRVDDGFGLRADVDFLRPKGELLRRMTGL